MASSSLDLARRHRKQVLRVLGEDVPGPERPGLWTTILAAQGLAAVFGGHIVDPARGAVGGLPLEGLVPSDKARVHVGRHICVPAAPGLRGGSWLTTLGCRNFGLPELELHGIEPARVENAARLMAGVAQHLVEGHDPARPFPGTVTLTLGDLQRALGLRVGPSPAGARGWTRVGLQTRRVLDDDRGRLEVRAPGNYRGSRRDWIAFALADLLGPPRSRRSNDELSAAE